MKSETVVDKISRHVRGYANQSSREQFLLRQPKMSGSNEQSWTKDELRMAKYIWCQTQLTQGEMVSTMQKQHDLYPFVHRPIDPRNPINLTRQYTAESMNSMLHMMGRVDEIKMPRNINRDEGHAIMDMSRYYSFAQIATELNQRLQTQDFTKRAVADYSNLRRVHDVGQPICWPKADVWPERLTTAFVTCYYDPNIDRTSCRDMVTSLVQMLQEKFPGEEAKNFTPECIGNGLVILSKRGYIRPVAATVGSNTGFLPDLIVEQSPDLRLQFEGKFLETFHVPDKDYRFS